jgi:hypothetical protein
MNNSKTSVGYDQVFRNLEVFKPRMFGDRGNYVSIPCSIVRWKRVPFSLPGIAQ